ncbi:hypothetical protein RZS28_13795 [Methylocapsa polymorpha]|uniref:Uncharacterized protein n=1 Tax=Methylocapsa polymorpha TaxID=3080828 RepID=A0ABZ0HQJ2_9HYPH|nr:hypothetical protein RZS28_13795 [Methylocapsa sp. RX1]
MFRISGLFAIFLLAAAGVIGGFCSAVSARPLTPAERRYFPWDGILPECGDPEVLERIQSRFYDRESEFWKTGLEIAGFEEVREIGYRSNGLDYIPRRYCVGRAFLNDGRSRSVSYSINKELGITGVGFGVEWCVAGLDRNDAYSPACKMAQP